MLGEVLRDERKRRNLTIQDIEHGTSIRSLYIENIENGDYDKLPGDVYTKGFIRSYADYLNLNADELIKQFNAERNPVVTAGTIEDNSTADGDAVVAEPSEIPSRRERNKNKEKNFFSSSSSNLSDVNGSGSNFKIIAAVVLIAALAAGAWAYLSNAGSEVVDIDVKQEQETTNIEQPKIAQKETVNTNLDLVNKDNTEKTVSAAPQTKTQGINLQAKFNGECWTQVIADGMLIYEDTVSPGQVLSWQGNENVTIRLGNAGAVEIANNGQNVGYLGGVGEVTERTFTKH